jgi:chaperonin GroEL (HSP60 family)
METSNKYTEILDRNISAINLVINAVTGTIGPKGLDVMLVDKFGNFKCTNDGVEILSNMELNHPVMKLIVQAAKSQEARVGDGTTTVAILCGAILNQAQKQISNGIQAIRLIEGIKLGVKLGIDELKACAKPIKSTKDKALENLVKISSRGDEEITRLIMLSARQAESSNNSLEALLDCDSGYEFSDSVSGVLNEESRILDGLFIRKKTHFNYPNKFKNIDGLVIEGPFEPEPMSSEAVSTDEGVKKYEQNIQLLLETAKRISKAGIKAVFCSSSMMPAVEEFFVREEIFVMTHLKSSDINRLINISGAKLTTRSKLFNIDALSILSYAGKFENIDKHEDLGGFCFLGKKKYQPSILIGAETESVLEERKLIAIDACKALVAGLRNGYVIGEGVTELNVSTKLKEKLQDLNLDNEILVGANIITRALKAPFEQILTNAGLDPNKSLELLELGSENQCGIDLDTGKPINLVTEGILDPTESKLSALKIAGELAVQILRINSIIQAK